jgi:DNA-binding response OmpR family regulator
LSAFTSAENKKRAFEVGFQKYHTKPFEPDLLIVEILAVANNNTPSATFAEGK